MASSIALQLAPFNGVGGVHVNQWLMSSLCLLIAQFVKN